MRLRKIYYNDIIKIRKNKIKKLSYLCSIKKFYRN